MGRFDYFSEFAHLGTDNDLPNNKYRNKTYAGRFGGAIAHNTDLSGTVRWIDRRFESPNGVSFYTTPDDAFQTNRLYFVGIGSQTQITQKWQGRFASGSAISGALRQSDPQRAGHRRHRLRRPDDHHRRERLLRHRAGRARLRDLSTRRADRRARASTRRPPTSCTGISVVSGGGDAEREQAFPGDDIHGEPTTTRNNSALWVEGRGTLGNRVSLTAGIGHARIEGFASRYSPRLSVAASLRTPTDRQFFGDTRLTFNAGKGIKATSAGAVNSSLFTLLQRTPAGSGAGGGRRHWTDRSRTRPQSRRRPRAGDVARARARPRRLFQQRVLRSDRVRQPEPADLAVRHCARRRGGRRDPVPS